MKKKVCISLILFSILLILSCHKEKEPECTIENITADVIVSDMPTIIIGNFFDIPITFSLIGTCRNTVAFDCLLKIENLDDSTYIFRDTFPVHGFIGTNTFVENFTFVLTQPGQYKITVCADFFNEIQEITEDLCQ